MNLCYNKRKVVSLIEIAPVLAKDTLMNLELHKMNIQFYRFLATVYFGQHDDFSEVNFFLYSSFIVILAEMGILLDVEFLF